MGLEEKLSEKVLRPGASVKCSDSRGGAKGNATCEIDIITAPGDGLNPAFLIHVHGIVKSQYLFNVPEGFSRFVLEHRLRPGLGLRGVFVTSLTQALGLPGLVMRTRGEGHGGFEFFGPSNGTMEFVSATQHVCRWNSPAVMVTEIRDDMDVYEDEQVIVYPFFVESVSGGGDKMQVKKRKTDKSQSVKSDSTRVYTGLKFERHAIFEQLTNLTPQKLTTKHEIFKRKYNRNLECCEFGSVWTRTLSHETETEKNENKINHHCNLVLGGFVCHVKSIDTSIIISNLNSSFGIGTVDCAASRDVGQCIEFGTLGGECVADTLYPRIDKGKLKRFDVRRVGESGRDLLGFHATARLIAKLNAVCPHVFPLPFVWDEGFLRGTPGRSEGHEKNTIDQASKIFVGLEGCRVSQFCSDECISNADEFHALHKIPEHINAEDVEEIKAECTKSVKNSTDFEDKTQSSRLNNMNAAMSLKKILLQSRSKDDDKAPPAKESSPFVYIDNIQGPYVAFLGTGSAEPSKYRGPSAIYFEMKDSNNQLQCFLMDCGEGTFGQLIRVFGYHGALKRLKKMQFIWISHRHADHMSGVIEMLCQRPKDSKRLLIVGPMAAIRWISSVKRALGIDNVTVEHTAQHLNPGTLVHSFLRDMYGAQVKFLQVHHCPDSYGIVIRLRNGFKLVYSGDTEPCERLIMYGKCADLLIHEATFEPDMVSDARRKKHSTVQEALEVASRMSAKRTILTHFSQRYPKFPIGIPVESQKPIGVAFDGMVVPLAILDKVSAVTTMVAQVFTN
eukprot:jgi/Picsp_1/6101/NSC_03455-R1_im:7145112 protein